MRSILTAVLMAIAVAVSIKVYTPIHPASFRSQPRPDNFLGRYGDNPDNWQAQSQKKEGTILCPPFCGTEVQERGRWHAE